MCLRVSSNTTENMNMRGHTILLIQVDYFLLSEGFFLLATSRKMKSLQNLGSKLHNGNRFKTFILIPDSTFSL